MQVSHQSWKGSRRPSYSHLGLPSMVVIALLFTAAALALLNGSAARATEYPTSVNYGGTNKSVDLSSEATAVDAAMDASSDEGKALWLGLSPADQEKNQWLNPANRTIVEEGYPLGPTDPPTPAGEGSVFRSGSEFTAYPVAPRGWCYGGITAVGRGAIPLTWLKLIDYEYAKFGASFALGADAWTFVCQNGRTRVYFLVRAYGKSLPQVPDGVRPEYQVQAVRENGETKGFITGNSLFQEIDPDTDNLHTPYGLSGYAVLEFPMPQGGAVPGRRAKELRIPVAVLDINEGAMKPRTLKTDFEYARLIQPTVTRSAQEEAEQEPTAPLVTTTANPAVGTGTVTLDGWFNPSNAGTRYYFQYGPTSAYTTTIPALPGSGIYSGVAPVHAQQFVSGLTVNATYHYRLVASNSQGITVGDDQTFTTAPYPAEGSTGAAEKVDLQGATLTASVSPRGANAYYKFEYGTSANPYSAQTSAQFAGSGGQVTVTDKVAGLAPNTVYHYRLIAWNSAGTITGADKTFRTAPYEESSTWSVRMPSTSANAWEWVFYRGSGGQLTERFYNGTSWQTYVIGGQVASGSTPAVVRVPSENSQDKIWVFYRSATTGKLTVASFTAGVGWATQDLGVEMAPGTSPSVLRSPTFDPTDRIWVFSNGKNGKLQYSLFSGGGWANTELATQLAPGTSPAAVRAPSSDPNERVWVFSNGLNGKLQNTYYAGGATGGWANAELGTQMSPGSSPAVVRAPTANGFLGVFTNTGGSLGETYTTGGAWSFANLGAQMEAGTSPAAVRAPTPESQGFAAVFTHGPKGPNGEPGRLGETYYAGTAWSFANLGTQMEAGTSPSALRAPSFTNQGFTAVFTMGPKGPSGEQGRMGQTYYTTGWAFMDMGVPMYWF